MVRAMEGKRVGAENGVVVEDKVGVTRVDSEVETGAVGTGEEVTAGEWGPSNRQRRPRTHIQAHRRCTPAGHLLEHGSVRGACM